MVERVKLNRSYRFKYLHQCNKIQELFTISVCLPGPWKAWSSKDCMGLAAQNVSIQAKMHTHAHRYRSAFKGDEVSNISHSSSPSRLGCIMSASDDQGGRRQKGSAKKLKLEPSEIRRSMHLEMFLSVRRGHSIKVCTEKSHVIVINSRFWPARRSQLTPRRLLNRSVEACLKG